MSGTTMAYEYRETLLKVEGVNLNLGGKSILRDLDLEIKNIHRPGLTQGQVVGLLGPSGMGKTQLFRIISGLNVPDTGHVLLHGDKRVKPGMVGVVAQNYPLFPHRTIRSNLRVAGQQSEDSGDIESRVSKMLDRFGLSEHGEKYPAQLSGGQRQRAAVAQQFMCSEGFLLMDEPFSGLDPLALDRMCNFIIEMAQTDELNTFIVVTHDISAAVAVCDTLWLLGRDHDAAGNFIPGARIQQSINLIDRGLAWRKGIGETPEFYATCNEIHGIFSRL